MSALKLIDGKLRKALGALILLSSCAFLFWGIWPSQVMTKNLILEGVSPGTSSTEGLAPGQLFSGSNPVVSSLSDKGAALEPRRSTLTWQHVIRKEDPQVIRLFLEDTGVQTGRDQDPGGVYADYNILAEARLDLAGVEVIPRETISQPMLPGVPISFSWIARPDRAGEFRGTVWLYFHFIPLNEGAREGQQAISVQSIDIRAVALFGLGGRAARVIGVCGLLLGVFLVIGRHGLHSMRKRLGC